MKSKLADTKARLKRILVQDKYFAPKRLENILKSELTDSLSTYMNLEDLQLVLRVNEAGKYELFVKAIASRLLVTNVAEVE